MKQGSIRLLATLAATILLTSTGLSPALASSSNPNTEITKTKFVDKSCVEQVERAFEKVQQVPTDKDLAICTGSIIVEQDPIETISISEANEIVELEAMGPEQSKMFLKSAAAGKIKSRKWTHAYWGGSNYEKHKGKTYWDGSKAWVKKHRGKAGNHYCHTEGSLQVGWTVTPRSCTKPSAGNYADSLYRFDASLFVKGSPITLGVGLHYRVSKKGVVKTWQVGG